MNLAHVRWLRRLGIPLLRLFGDRDVLIRHHWTGQDFYLNLFKHKGYWFYGKRREMGSLVMFSKIISPGWKVCEVGGHIGYFSLFFKSLVRDGEVIVFEPGQNNLPYIRRNVHGKNITLVEIAVGLETGQLILYLDSLTGQNNSILNDFKGLKSNIARSFIKVTVTPSEVECISLDQFYAEEDNGPDFIKIDVEGAEFDVLAGAKKCIQRRLPAIMVEVQFKEAEVSEFLSGLGYLLFDPSGQVLSPGSRLAGNIFALHKDKHASIFSSVGLVE
jgi:FkbM family methyltransferase